MAKVVCIPYERLLDPNSDLTRELVEVTYLVEGGTIPECLASSQAVLHAVLHFVLGPMLPVSLQGYGPNGLGIITISGVPNFQQLRQRLLPLAQDFAVSTLAAGRLN